MLIIKMKKKHGFSLIEIMLSIAIIAVLAVGVSMMLNNYKRSIELDYESKSVVSIIRKAQTYSATGKDEKRWGVYFASNNKIILFRDEGGGYATAIYKEEYPLSSSVVIGSVSLNGGGNEIIFNGQDGSTAQYGNANGNSTAITLQDSQNSTILVNIIVTELGNTEISKPAPVAPQPPAIPSQITDLNASSGDTQVTLNWSAPSDNRSEITDYKIYRSTISNTEIYLANVGSAATSYIDTGLTNGTTYYYKVSAINSIGEAVLSNEASSSPSACGSATTVTDIDNNSYDTIAIGTQCWMKQNLKVTRNAAGTAITRYCYTGSGCGYDPANNFDGGLYTWNTMMDGSVSCNGTGASQPACSVPVQGICPNGWHIPSHHELTLLEKNAGSNPNSFPYDNTTFGSFGADEGTNLRYPGGSSGFDFVLVGYRNVDGTFLNKSWFAHLVSSTQYDASNVWTRVLQKNDPSIMRDYYDKDYGNPVRCLKDLPVASQITNLNATSGNTEITLSWSAPDDNGSTITDYKIYRGTVSDGEIYIANVGSAVTSHTDTGLANGTTYFYKVSAINGYGEGAMSNETSSAPNACGSTQTFQDMFGDIYNTVAIGTQCWAKENLRVIKNPAGDPIVRNCYNNDINNCVNDPASSLDGGFYDWYTAMNGSTEESAQGICPAGWHIPRDSELYTLESYLRDGTNPCDPNRIAGGCALAGNKLKYGGTTGFNAIYTGARLSNGSFVDYETKSAFWSSSQSGSNAWIRQIDLLSSSVVGRFTGSKIDSYPIRCLKDAPVPSKITNINANSADSEISLTWTAPTTNGSPITDYEIYRGTTSGSEGYLGNVGSALTSYTNTGLTNGTLYYYRISAINKFGGGVPSTEKTAMAGKWYAGFCTGLEVSPDMITKPSMYSSWKTSETACNIPQCGQDGGQSGDELVDPQLYPGVDFSEYPAQNACKSIGGRLATYSELNCLLPWVFNITNLNRDFMWTNMETGDISARQVFPYSSYYTLNYEDYPSKQWDLGIIRCVRTASPVPDFVMYSATSGNTQVTLNWTAPNDNGSAITSYKIYRNAGFSFPLPYLATVDSSTFSYTDTGLTNGTQYYYSVSAVNSNGEGAMPGEYYLDAIPSAPAPSQVTGLTAAAGNTQVILDWLAPYDGGSEITGYKIYKGTSSGSETLLATIGNVLTYTSTGLINGNTYYYKVSAVNAGGEGLQSDEINTTLSCGAITSVIYEGETYDTVSIGTQCWLNRNLNVGTQIFSIDLSTDNSIIEKYCYWDLTEYCASDGAFYQWNESMKYLTTPGAQGICPDGWHIPTDSEWWTLENYLKDTGQSCDPNRSGQGCDTAGAKLKTGGTSGFGAIFTGTLWDLNFFGRDESTSFWSSDDGVVDIMGNPAARTRTLTSTSSLIYRNVSNKLVGGHPVRCIR